MNDRETRCYSGEVRAEQYDNAPTHILGYGSVFNSRSEPLHARLLRQSLELISDAGEVKKK